MIAADAHSPLDRVRAKLEETFGEFELAQTPEPHGGAERRISSRRSAGPIDEHRSSSSST